MQSVHPDIEVLSAYLEGELAQAERLSLESHLSGCAACQASLNELRELVTDLQDLPLIEPPTGFSSRVMERIDREVPVGLWSWLKRQGILPFLVPAATAALAFIVLRAPQQTPIPTPALDRQGESAPAPSLEEGTHFAAAPASVPARPPAEAKEGQGKQAAEHFSIPADLNAPKAEPAADGAKAALSLLDSMDKPNEAKPMAPRGAVAQPNVQATEAAPDSPKAPPPPQAYAPLLGDRELDLPPGKSAPIVTEKRKDSAVAVPAPVLEAATGGAGTMGQAAIGAKGSGGASGAAANKSDLGAVGSVSGGSGEGYGRGLSAVSPSREPDRYAPAPAPSAAKAPRAGLQTGEAADDEVIARSNEATVETQAEAKKETAVTRRTATASRDRREEAERKGEAEEADASKDSSQESRLKKSAKTQPAPKPDAVIVLVDGPELRYQLEQSLKRLHLTLPTPEMLPGGVTRYAIKLPRGGYAFLLKDLKSYTSPGWTPSPPDARIEPLVYLEVRQKP